MTNLDYEIEWNDGRLKVVATTDEQAGSGLDIKEVAKVVKEFYKELDKEEKTVKRIFKK